MTLTRSATRSQTASAPGYNMVDSTGDLSATVVTDAPVAVSPGTLYAVTFTVPETDSSCGPGAYVLTGLDLALSRVSAASVQLRLQLYTVNAATGLPASAIGSTLLLSGTSLPAVAGYVPLILSSASWRRGINTASAASYALAVSSNFALNWHGVNASGGSGGSTPKATLSADLVTSSTSGDSWEALTPAVAARGVRLRTVKAACTQTPSSSGTPSPSSTPTIPSPSQTQTATGFPEEVRLGGVGVGAL